MPSYFLASPKYPKIMREWSNRVWSAIEEGKVFVGMTAEQARMS
jgi:hypothetical protein